MPYGICQASYYLLHIFPESPLADHFQWSKGKGFLEVFTKNNYYFCVIYFRVFSKTSKLDKIINNY